MNQPADVSNYFTLVRRMSGLALEFVRPALQTAFERGRPALEEPGFPKALMAMLASLGGEQLASTPAFKQLEQEISTVKFTDGPSDELCEDHACRVAEHWIFAWVSALQLTLNELPVVEIDAQLKPTNLPPGETGAECREYWREVEGAGNNSVLDRGQVAKIVSQLAQKLFANDAGTKHKGLLLPGRVLLIDAKYEANTLISFRATQLPSPPRRPL